MSRTTEGHGVEVLRTRFTRSPLFNLLPLHIAIKADRRQEVGAKSGETAPVILGVEESKSFSSLKHGWARIRNSG